MKIEFEVPDWAIGRQINIFAGSELLGQKIFHRDKNRADGKLTTKEYYTPLQIKTKEEYKCNGCGDCCNMSGVPEKIVDRIKEYAILDATGGKRETACPMLGREELGHFGCILGAWIPFSCAKSNCEGWSENCSEKLVPVEIGNSDISLLVV